MRRGKSNLGDRMASKDERIDVLLNVLLNIRDVIVIDVRDVIMMLLIHHLTSACYLGRMSHIRHLSEIRVAIEKPLARADSNKSHGFVFTSSLDNKSSIISFPARETENNK